MSILSVEIRRIKSSALAHNAGWMLAGQGINVILWAAYFVGLARLLGVEQYGVFAGAFAFVSLAVPYSGLGSGLLFMRYVSMDRGNFAAYWGNILMATVGVGLLLAIGLHFLAPHLINPASASLTLLVALGECVFRQLVICAGQVFQAFEQLRMTAAAGFVTVSLRLIAVLVLAVLLHRITAWQWAVWSLAASVLASIALVAIVTARFGRPRFEPKLLASRFGEGFNFSIAGSTQSVYNDVDKTMLSHYGMNVANGIYTLAYRIVDMATIPIIAVDAAVLPRFFRQGLDDAEGAVDLSERLAKRSAVLGIGLAVCMFAAAPLIPHLIGSGFKESVLALRWLCLIPAFRGVHQLTGSAVTGLGFQRYRTMAQFAAAAFNFGLNVWLIPRYGWMGAAWASLATDGGLGIVNVVVARRLPAILRKERCNGATA